VLWLAGMTLPDMAKRGGGSFITIGSIGGIKANTVIGAYGMSKAADHHLGAQPCGRVGPKNVRVNAIAPGLIRTEFARALWEDDKRRAEREADDAVAAPGRAHRYRRSRGVPRVSRGELHYRADDRRRWRRDDRLVRLRYRAW
jgi:NAD(P)-dependent dehydrogenase (short-subunit alcohol dehydrogenase family)